MSRADTSSAELCADGVQAEEAAVGIRYSDFSYVTHQKRLKAATNLTASCLRIYGMKRLSGIWESTPQEYKEITLPGIFHTRVLHKKNFPLTEQTFEKLLHLFR